MYHTLRCGIKKSSMYVMAFIAAIFIISTSMTASYSKDVSVHCLSCVLALVIIHRGVLSPHRLNYIVAIFSVRILLITKFVRARAVLTLIARTRKGRVTTTTKKVAVYRCIIPGTATGVLVILYYSTTGRKTNVRIIVVSL